MSGIVGHSLYAVLGAKAAAHRGVGLAAIATRNFPSYLAGAYLGSDIQVMPEAWCVDTGREVGFGTVPLEKSPLTGGAVRLWSLAHGGRDYRPKEIHELFYGRAHVVFGWPRAAQANAVAWERLPEYFAATLEDTLEFYGPSERTIAYVLGWMVHVVSDSLIKSQRAGLELHLLDGKYTPRNRPIQDLVSFHEIGIKEFHLNWPALLADLAATPVEPAQIHYMRIGEKRGRLAATFPELWDPAEPSLLRAVLAENRRWCVQHARDELAAVALTPGPDGRPECSAEIRRRTGLTYAQMVDLAEKAHYRRALGYIGDVIADLMEATVRASPRLARLGGHHGPGWDVWMQRW